MDDRAPGALKRVLVVDDDTDILDLVRDHFAGRYEVDTARSGSAAVASFFARRPHVIFLDVNMPGLNGVDVLRWFRSTDPDVPVVMLTANADVTAACLEAGALGYVPKPFVLAYLDHMAALAVESAELARTR